MEENQLNVDLAMVAKEALRDRKPGEDIDVVLLRICKDLYGKLGLTAFQTVRNAVETYATQRNLGVEGALQEIAGGSGVSSVTTFTKSFGTQKVVTSLDELPADMREQVQKVLEFRKAVSGSEGLVSLLGLVVRHLLHSRKPPVDVTPPGPTSEPSATSQPSATIQPGTPAQPQIRPQAPTQPGMVRCENCKLEYSKERTSCPGCGTERKRSFWTRLFGS